jgi:spore maturation protein CgeB
LRILIVDHLYERFLHGLYEREPTLATQDYAAQARAVSGSLFGETDHEVAALRQNGHTAEAHLWNAVELNAAWAGEMGLAGPSRRWLIGRRRRWIPWPHRGATEAALEAVLLERIRVFEPDVVHVQAVDHLRPDLVRRIRATGRVVTGQIAAPLPTWVQLDAYSLLFSSLPNFVERFRAAGVDAEWLPLAFEPSIVDAIGAVDRDVSVSFVGGLSRPHAKRVKLLETVAQTTSIEVWSPDQEDLAQASPLRQRMHGAAWGADMYRVLARSRITINTHIDVAEGYANNLRLYEATGMGALLVTDRGRNLAELFEDGREVVAYGDASECRDLIRHYLDHPAEATTIAAAGKRRTLATHTWDNRMARMISLLEPRINSGRMRSGT